MIPVRLLIRFVLVGCIAAIPFIPPTSSNGTSGEIAVAGLYPEVRLRKLHLVRPDLIPYPILFEVCC
jgi:hypothetical protein